MDPNILAAVIGAVALGLGLLLGKFIFAKNTNYWKIKFLTYSFNIKICEHLYKWI